MRIGNDDLRPVLEYGPNRFGHVTCLSDDLQVRFILKQAP
jgi:hypothetical protein